VAVRTQGLGLDSLVAYQDGDGVVRPMVSEPYLRTLVHVANRRFAVNAERTERFRNDLLRRVRDAGGAKGARVGGESGEWEAADVRRERKRAEGLRRAGEMRERRAAREGEDVGEGGNGNPLHTDALDSGLFVTGDR
jgi:tRNA wybutosine-synthesizing protein 3